MPEKFNNKTNGITQRRFLMHGNPLLADWVTEKLGTKDWITDLSLMSGLKKYADDEASLKEFMDIKYKNKERLARRPSPSMPRRPGASFWIPTPSLTCR